MVIIRLFPMLFWAVLVSGQAYAEERLAILEFRNIDNAMSRSEVGYIAEIFRDLGAKSILTGGLIQMIMASAAFDAADNYIADNAAQVMRSSSRVFNERAE